MAPARLAVTRNAGDADPVIIAGGGDLDSKSGASNLGIAPHEVQSAGGSARVDQAPVGQAADEGAGPAQGGAWVNHDSAAGADRAQGAGQV